MTVTNEEVTPALYEHAKRVFQEMQKRGHIERWYGEEDGWVSGREAVTATNLSREDVTRVVYEGHLTRLFADLQIANPYYTKIVVALKGQNCIEQIRRGGGVALSKWVMHHEPDEETFRSIMERKRAPKGKGAIIDQRVTDLARMTSELYEAVEQLSSDFEKLATRVREMAK